MMKQTENETFRYTYSAKQQEELLNIRKKYTEQSEDKMNKLRRMDRAVTRKATAVSIGVGVVGTLIMGVGMSLVMSEFGELLGNAAQPVGIIIGVIGMAMLVCAYPLYNVIVKKERKKIAPEILRLTEELMK